MLARSSSRTMTAAAVAALAPRHGPGHRCGWPSMSCRVSRVRIGQANVSKCSPGEVAAAATVAALLSGAPSTLQALLTRRSPLAAARAAGALLGRPGLARGAVAHGVMSLGWTTVLAVILPERHRRSWGAVAGLATGLLDLSIARRKYPGIAALPTSGQLADHVAFGTLAALMLARRVR